MSEPTTDNKNFFVYEDDHCPWSTNILEIIFTLADDDCLWQLTSKSSYDFFNSRFHLRLLERDFPNYKEICRELYIPEDEKARKIFIFLSVYHDYAKHDFPNIKDFYEKFFAHCYSSLDVIDCGMFMKMGLGIDKYKKIFTGFRVTSKYYDTLVKLNPQITKLAIDNFYTKISVDPSSLENLRVLRISGLVPGFTHPKLESISFIVDDGRVEEQYILPNLKELILQNHIGVTRNIEDIFPESNRIESISSSLCCKKYLPNLKHLHFPNHNTHQYKKSIYHNAKIEKFEISLSRIDDIIDLNKIQLDISDVKEFHLYIKPEVLEHQKFWDFYGLMNRLCMLKVCILGGFVSIYDCLRLMDGIAKNQFNFTASLRSFSTENFYSMKKKDAIKHLSIEGIEIQGEVLGLLFENILGFENLEEFHLCDFFYHHNSKSPSMLKLFATDYKQKISNTKKDSLAKYENYYTSMISMKTIKRMHISIVAIEKGIELLSNSKVIIELGIYLDDEIDGIKLGILKRLLLQNVQLRKLVVFTSISKPSIVELVEKFSDFFRQKKLFYFEKKSIP